MRNCKICGYSLKSLDDYCSIECAEKDPGLEKPCLIGYGDWYFGVVGIPDDKQHRILQNTDASWHCPRCRKDAKHQRYEEFSLTQCVRGINKYNED